MNTWFNCKVRYPKTMENGTEKRVTEAYLVDALSFTEAEARIIREMTPFVGGEFTVSGVARAGYSELFYSDDPQAGYWFKFKLAFIVLDEKTGNEKKTFTHVLVQSTGFRQAVKDLDSHMAGSMADYIIVSASESGIMDVYPYAAGEEGEPEAGEDGKPEAG